ncbi:hypothetical protein HK100_002907 [Physocladia obscura]|uniref:Thioredoxin domain-containing protein n=1 Tax=Physocladia obscura TaxID=109957 RepID=A0AAD5X9S6_9FUNG|nr:hypothetical protein HK100_002907 [Physocladia obscura]
MFRSENLIQWLAIQNVYYEREWDKIPGFGIGKIQCGNFETFCDGFHVDGYPTLNVFKDGAFVVEIAENELAALQMQAEALLAGNYTTPDFTSLSPSVADINSNFDSLAVLNDTIAPSRDAVISGADGSVNSARVQGLKASVVVTGSGGGGGGNVRQKTPSVTAGK